MKILDIFLSSFCLFTNKQDMQLPYRKSPRFANFDYAEPGIYFITICTQDRMPYFGFIKNGVMCLNDLGALCHKEIILTGKMRPNVKIHEYVVMPDHVHILIEIYELMNDGVGACGNTPAPGTVDMGALDIRETETGAFHYLKTGALPHPPTGKYPNQSLGSVIGNIKSRVTKYANQSQIPFQWQRSYHDRIVGDDHALRNIQKYIVDNPKNYHQ